MNIQAMSSAMTSNMKFAKRPNAHMNMAGNMNAGMTGMTTGMNMMNLNKSNMTSGMNNMNMMM